MTNSSTRAGSRKHFSDRASLNPSRDAGREKRADGPRRALALRHTEEVQKRLPTRVSSTRDHILDHSPAHRHRLRHALPRHTAKRASEPALEHEGGRCRKSGSGLSTVHRGASVHEYLPNPKPQAVVSLLRDTSSSLPAGQYPEDEEWVVIDQPSHVRFPLLRCVPFEADCKFEHLETADEGMTISQGPQCRE